MKKAMFPLAIPGAVSCLAHAQTNIRIYGIVDTGYIKQTGSDLKMGKYQ